jgi:hypothetical protein
MEQQQRGCLDVPGSFVNEVDRNWGRIVAISRNSSSIMLVVLVD